MAFDRARPVNLNTPTPVRGVGTTEKLASHRADDGPYEKGNEFERSIVSRSNDFRGTVRTLRNKRARAR